MSLGVFNESLVYMSNLLFIFFMNLVVLDDGNLCKIILIFLVMFNEIRVIFLLRLFNNLGMQKGMKNDLGLFDFVLGFNEVNS